MPERESPEEKTGTDMVETIIKSGGANEGRKDMLQPGDIDKLGLDAIVGKKDLRSEEERQAAAETETAGEEGAKEGAEAAGEGEGIQVSEEVIKAIEAKVDSGAELSEDEQKILDEMTGPAKKAEEPPAAAAVETKVYRIGRNVISHDEAKVQARGYFKIGNLDLAPEAEQQLIDSYVKIQNKDEANRRIDSGYKENAAERARNDAARAMIAAERARQEEILRHTDETLREIQATKAELQRIAAQGLKKEDVTNPETGQIDPDKNIAYMRQEEAKQGLQAVAAKEQRLSEQVASANVEVFRSTLREFQANHTEYQTTEDIVEIAKKLQSRQPLTDPKDGLKVREILQLYREAADAGDTIDGVHEMRTAQNSLAVKPAAQAALGRSAKPAPQQALKKQDILAKIAEYRKRQEASAGGPAGGSTGIARTGEKKSTARKMIESDHAVLGSGGDDPFLRETKY